MEPPTSSYRPNLNSSLIACFNPLKPLFQSASITLSGILTLTILPCLVLMLGPQETRQSLPLGFHVLFVSRCSIYSQSRYHLSRHPRSPHTRNRIWTVSRGTAVVESRAYSSSAESCIKSSSSDMVAANLSQRQSATECKLRRRRAVGSDLVCWVIVCVPLLIAIGLPGRPHWWMIGRRWRSCLCKTEYGVRST